MIKLKFFSRIVLLLSISLLVDSCKKDGFPVPPASTVPLFSYSIDNNGFAPANVTFTNESIIPDEVGVANYSWSFGDGTSSLESNPVHLFSTSGVFSVKLIVKTSISGEIKEITKKVIIKNSNASGTPVFFTDGINVYSGFLNSDEPAFGLLPIGPFKECYGMTIDTVHSKLYISDEGANKIFQCDLDGANLITFRSGLALPDGIAFDYSTNMLYWTTSDGVERADIFNTDVNQKETVASGQSTFVPEGVSVDPLNHKVYWTNYEDGGGLWSKNIDGSGESLIIPGVVGGSTLVIGDRVFFDQLVVTTDGNDKQLKSANLDGTGVSTITTGISKVVFALAYDPDGNKVYWGDRTPGKIMRSNLDGSVIETWYEAEGSSPRGLVFGKKK
jgi:PKD repeat protein